MTSEAPASLLALGRARPADMNFVRSSWFTSFWKSGAAPKVSYEQYREEMPKQIERTLEHSTVLVCWFSNIPEEIAGYAVIQGDLLHWCYVKHPYRRQHIATALAAGCTEYTARTRLGDLLAASMSLKFNPWRATR